MAPTVEISGHVIEKLKHLDNGTEGTLLTTAENSETLLVLGLIISNNSDFNPAESNCPAGLVFLGSFKVSTEEKNVEDNLLTIHVNPTSSEIVAYYQGIDDVVPKKISFVEIRGALLAEKLFLVRSIVVLPFCCELNAESVQKAIEDLRTKTDELRVVELNGLDLQKPFKTPGKKNGYASVKGIEVVPASVQFKASTIKESDDEPTKALIIDYKKKSSKCCWFDLTLDTLTVVPRYEPASYLLEFVELSLRVSLSLIENCLLTQLKNTGSISMPEIFHFLPETMDHFLTVVYPKNKLDKDLVDERSKLHSAFCLPTDRPMLMRANAFCFVTEERGTELINPHEGVAVSGIAGGEPSIVAGHYAYHHYCQQGVDDNGWGCAYRSLQTLCSWFKLQGYTNRPVPTIQEIQKCLVSIGDKSASFVGSSQWIGSTEVGFCLDTLLGISSRIINVSSGEEMSMKGGELSHHFRSQGTPVMIGGGNLAHTILGVDYNKKTGEIKFLILDPHYTGADDLNTIVSKGWCGWKDIKFWKKGSFYNMCMPIRPKYI